MSASRTLVLGGTGFVGRHVVEALADTGSPPRIAAGRSAADFRDLNAARACFEAARPEVIINCAAHVGSLVYVSEQAADVVDDNMRMVLNVYRAAAEVCPEATVVEPVANCAFPGQLSLYREEDLWAGPLHSSVLSYGSTRRMMVVLAECYRMQKRLKTISLYVPNMYGPYESTDPTKAHALAALVSKVVKAKYLGISEIPVWGTGVAVREWLFAPDFARVVRDVMARRCEATFDTPINVGQRSGMSVRELLQMIVEESGYQGSIAWDASKPDGAPQKVMDDTRFRTHFPDFRFTPLREGIRATIRWYESQLPY